MPRDAGSADPEVAAENLEPHPPVPRASEHVGGERLDGNGYPRGLHAGDIALETRIITTADIFDAITAERPYRASVPVPRTLEIIAETVGTALDPQCFAALQGVVAKLDAPPHSQPPPATRAA